METTKKLRSRTRSSNIFPEPVPETKPEEAPVEETNKANTNLNGENVENAEPQKDADKTEATVSETAEPENTLTNEEIVPEAPKENETVEDKEPSKPEESTVKTRKRKANEMKTGDETDESSIEKKSNIEVNPAVTTETIESENTETSEVKADVLEEPPTLVINEEVEIKTDKDDSMIESDITLPPKQTLGKGKRARIPNKRYSDILLSPHHKPKIENGSDNELSISHDLNVVAPERKPRNVSSSPATPPLQYKKNKTASDVTDPNFLKPFELGWKRELVWRATYDAQAAKRSGDIYYYNPMGKKYRSMREIADALKGKDLTLDNFTFTKEAIGLDDPEKEIIREAKFKAGPGLQKKVLTKKTVPAKAQTPSKVSSPKLASPKVTSPKANTPKNDVAKGNTRSVATKAKAPAKKGEKRKSEEDVEAEAVPAKTSPVAVRSTRGSAKWSKPAPESPPKPKKRLAYKVNNTVAISDKTDNKFMDHYLQNLSYGYNTLLYVFQYLKVQDLLRAGCVCTMWRDIASHALLWRTVRMKNSQVHSFDGLANTLRKHGTNHLDLRKMLLPSGGDEIWPQFSKAIERVDTLRKIELCRCPASVVEQLAVSNPDLEVINAVTIKCESMTLEPFANLKSIKELRLKSTGGLTLSSNIDSLKGLTTLKHLSLTSIKELHSMNLSVIAELTNLESLDLGECSDFPKNFGEDILVKLVNLEKLRLEKGQGNCHTFEILEAVKDMKRLEQLELVNFDIKTGFDNALGACSNIKKLLIIPTYISQSATTNHMVLGGVLRLHKTLSHFVWGVTLELLRVTELFVDQCEEPNAKEKKEKKPTGNGDSIPVLKPVPLITENDNEIPPAFEPPQVEILPLPNLQKLLLQSLPTTRVKILKIPFHATWRQSITDSVN